MKGSQWWRSLRAESTATMHALQDGNMVESGSLPTAMHACNVYTLHICQIDRQNPVMMRICFAMRL